MKAVTSFETSVAIASGNNVTSNKTLIFSLGLITVNEDQDVKKGNFVKLHVRFYNVGLQIFFLSFFLSALLLFVLNSIFPYFGGMSS
jgi:hypothetical protein